MQTKILLKFGLILFLIITASVFGFRAVKAELPVEAGLGQACNASTPCDSRLFCSGGECVQCEEDSNCDQMLGETCVSNVCTLNGGNNAGDLCATDDNCRSNLTCGTRGICEEAEIPAGCFDDNEDGVINEQDCNDTENADCTICQEAAPGPGDGEGTGGGDENWWGIDLTIEDVGNIINGLACWATRIATAVMVIFLILAGFRFMNARGNPTAYQAAVKNFQHVLIGIVVIMAVYVIIATVANAVGRTDFSLIPLIC